MRTRTVTKSEWSDSRKLGEVQRCWSAYRLRFVSKNEETALHIAKDGTFFVACPRRIVEPFIQFVQQDEYLATQGNPFVVEFVDDARVSAWMTAREWVAFKAV